MKIFEFILNEETDDGVNAISIVESPAIKENFIALKNQETNFAIINEEKRLILGAILVPNKTILRKNNSTGEEYYMYFSNDTVRKASQLFLEKGNQSNSTLEHQKALKGLTLVESWIVENTQKDKSNLYNLNLSAGTWAGAMKVNDEKIWDNYVKTGRVKGFSIEGFFTNKDEEKEELSEKEKNMLNEIFCEL